VSRCYEDFEVGAVYRSRIGRTVLEADNVWFTALTMNTNELHFNAQAAARTEFVPSFMAPKRDAAVDSFPATDAEWTV
jgi:acyl dehydratase